MTDRTATEYADFVYGGVSITDPFTDETGRFAVDPFDYYGVEPRGEETRRIWDGSRDDSTVYVRPDDPIESGWTRWTVSFHFVDEFGVESVASRSAGSRSEGIEIARRHGFERSAVRSF